MELSVTTTDNIAHVKLIGRLDTQGVDEIETKFTASIVPGHHHALVDLSGVSFMTSMGLRMLISVAKALKRHHAKLVLYAPQAAVAEVFMSASLIEIIPVVDDEAAAMHYVGA